MDFTDSDDLPAERIPLRVYIASRYSRKNEMQLIALACKEVGAICCTEWMYEPDSPDTKLGDVADEMLEHRANRDVNEMRSADLCVSFTEDPVSCYPRGGRHVEFGFCLALGIPLWIVGPRENIYHFLPWVEHFDDVNEMLRALREEAAK